jgi:hypothetical protein
VFGVPELFPVARELGQFYAVSPAISIKSPDVFADLKAVSAKEAVFYKERLDKV